MMLHIPWEGLGLDTALPYLRGGVGRRDGPVEDAVAAVGLEPAMPEC